MFSGKKKVWLRMNKNLLLYKADETILEQRLYYLPASRNECGSYGFISLFFVFFFCFVLFFLFLQEVRPLPHTHTTHISHRNSRVSVSKHIYSIFHNCTIL
uniref:Uncharacterized protein n=1 Tax=Anguilla anguilla TaxID=7936 RepID=A0A0E9X318_ANGAN